MAVKALRAAFSLGLMLALWTFARPAHAMTLAPFCDDRGATAIAPPPMLDASGESIGCPPPMLPDFDGPLLGLSLGQGNHRVPAFHGEALVARPPAPPSLSFAPPPSVRSERDPAVQRPHAGVHFRVERPPRS